MAPTPFQIVKNVIQHEASVVPTNQPALFQVWIGRDPTQLTGTPVVYKYTVWWVLYADRGEATDASAEDVMAPLVDACDAALRPAPGLDAQTLGGLVSYARSEGRTEVSEAPLGQQGVCVYPISILVPDGLKC